MYAVVANGLQTICKTQSELESIMLFYPYPKFEKCNSEEEGREWLRAHAREYRSVTFFNYGSTATSGYATIEYFIANNTIYYNIDTSKVGHIKVAQSDKMKMESKPERLKIKIENVMLDDNLISSHIIAITRILKILGEYVDVNIVVPDISIYLAVEKYTGSNYMIKTLKNIIATRLGGVSITIRESNTLNY